MPKTGIDFQNIKKLDRELQLSNPVIGELLDLSDTQLKRIKKKLKEEIEAWEQDTSELQEKLEHWHNLSEGIIEETDWPYEGAFETHIDLCGIYLKVYHSIERRSILGSENIWYAEAEPDHDELQDSLPEIETMLNYKARSEWNIEEMIPEAFACANRDGLSGLIVPYVIDIEHVEDKVVISNEQEFMEEFPDPEELGEDYEALFSMVVSEASEEAPLEIPIEFDKVVYEGPKAYLVERANLVTFPASARSLEKEYCRGWGHSFEIQRDEVRRKMEDEEWDKEECQEFLRKTKKNSSDYAPNYVVNRDMNVGISRSKNSGMHQFFELIYRMRLGKGAAEIRYHFIYNKEHDCLVMSKVYIYNADIMALFRIDRRPNQLDGKSIIGQLEFLNEELDLMHNQRVQSREITNVPSFKAKNDLKKGPDGFDPAAEENQWRPGVVFWLRELDAFEQFKVQPVDHGDSMIEEQNLFRIASFIMGVDIALFSGQTPSGDPQAPGNKTQTLISMGNLRMEDPIAELRYGVEQVGTICLSHLYQFGPAQIGYRSQEGNSQVTKYLKKRLLRNGLKIKMQGVTVVMNSDTEFNKWMERAAILSQTEPLIGQDPARRTELIRRGLRQGRIPNADKILPSIEEIKRQQVEMTKQAISEMMIQEQMQKAAQAQAQQQEMVKRDQESKKALMTALRDKVQVQNLTQKLVENSLRGTNGSK